jgi:hypothetical protein
MIRGFAKETRLKIKVPGRLPLSCCAAFPLKRREARNGSFGVIPDHSFRSQASEKEAFTLSATPKPNTGKWMGCSADGDSLHPAHVAFRSSGAAFPAKRNPEQAVQEVFEVLRRRIG